MTTKNTEVVMEYPIDNILETIKKSTDDWLNKHTEEHIENRVEKILDENLEKTLLLLMGFEKDTWGAGWKVNNCNGKNESSIAGQFLRNVCGHKVTEWLGKVSFTPATKAMEQAVKREYKDVFKRELIYKAREQAGEDAQKFLDNTLIEFTKHHRLEAEQKMHKLLTGDET